MRKIVEAEIMSEGNTKLKITLNNGKVVTGYSMGILPAFDDEGGELDYDVLALTSNISGQYVALRDEDIAKIEKA
jgi:hypothetical protein